MSILALAAGGVVGVTGQYQLDMFVNKHGPSRTSQVPLTVLILGTVAVGYAIGGDRPGTFGRGVMWSAAALPAALVAFVGLGMLAGGRS